MAAETLERIYKLLVDGTAAAQQLGRVANATEALNEKLTKAGEMLKTVGKVFAVVFATAQFVKGIQGAIDAMDEAAKASQRLGLSVKSLQEWNFALSLSGVDAGTFATAVGKVAQGINDIDSGKITDATSAMKAFGVTGKDTAEQAMDKLVKGFSELSDGPKKTALAIEIFGKAGKELIPLLNSGAEGVKAMREEFAKLGGGFSAEDAKRAEVFNDNLTKIGVAASMSAKAIAKDLLPALNTLTNAWVENVKQSGLFAGTLATIWQKITNNIGTAEEKLAFLIQRQKEQATIPGIDPLVLRSLDAQIRAQQAIVTAERAIREEQAATAAQAKVDADKRIANAIAEQKAIDDKAKKAKEAAEAEAKYQKAHKEALIENNRLMLVEGNKQAAKNLEDANKAREKEIELLAKENAEANENAVTSINYAKALNDLDQAVKDHTQSEYDRIVVEQQLQVWLKSGTEEQKAYAQALLDAKKKTDDQTKTLDVYTETLKVVGDAAQGFFDNLGRAAGDAGEVFRRAIQSMIANLLKLWAQKYIIDALFGAGGMFHAGTPGGPSFVGPPAALSAQAVATIPATDSQMNTRALGPAPMAAPPPLVTSGGLMAIPPAAQGQQGNNVEVHVHNNVAGVQVDAQANQDGTRIDVIVQRAKAALVADVRGGGSAFSSALEATYALGRSRG